MPCNDTRLRGKLKLLRLLGWLWWLVCIVAVVAVVAACAGLIVGVWFLSYGFVLRLLGVT